MKLSEALSLLQKKAAPFFKLEEACPGEFGEGPYHSLYLTTAGESEREEWMGDLTHTWFAHRYWEATMRGGGYEYRVPVADLEADEDREWFTYFGHNPEHDPLFTIPEGYRFVPSYKPYYELLSPEAYAARHPREQAPGAVEDLSASLPF